MDTQKCGPSRGHSRSKGPGPPGEGGRDSVRASALVCLGLSMLICQKEERVPLLPVSRDIVQRET